ncbi:MAG: trypsin-like serine protease [Deltaproteobacteria bacterium]|nr:trypsin-like serine protease [Deltaproteobacteria bacterium]
MRSSRRAATLAALGLLGSGCTAPMGASSSASASIVGGTETAEFPEVAALLYDGEFQCSAVLVGMRTLVTAAHCIYGFENDLAPLSVAFGPDLSQSPPTRALASAVVEPEYATNQSRDIALLELSEDAPVPPVPWSEAALGDFGPPLALTLVGFGDPGFEDDDGPRRRRTVDVDLSELTTITLRWNHADRGTCHGDSGGAAYADLGAGSVLVGVLNKGADDCSGWGAAMRTDIFADFMAGEAAGDDDDATLDPGGDDDDAVGSTGCQCSANAGSRPSWALLSLLVATLLRRRRLRPRRGGAHAPP